MLRRLFIQNAAIISQMEISFCEGLNILSGETGAGKSIILDALGFVLGSKADRTLIRHSAREMLAEGVFDISENHKAKQALSSMGFTDDEDEVIVSRTLSAEGKGDCRVNGRSVTLSMLRPLTELLIDVYGQSEHISLLKVSAHIELLDDYCGFDVQALKEKIRAELDTYAKTAAEIDSFGGSGQERERLLDLYSFQIEEISSAKIRKGEDESLSAERALIISSEKIRQALNDAYGAIKGEYGALSSLATAVSALSRVSGLSEKIQALREKAEESRYELEDVLFQISDLQDAFDFDEQKADRIEDRLELLKKLKRKYGPQLDDVLNYLAQTEAELERIKKADREIERLTEVKRQCLSRLYSLYTGLSEKRKASALKFEGEMVSELSGLNMGDASFKVFFAELPDEASLEKHLSPNGIDTVEFLLSANKGEPLRPLAKVISGGEMSRFMLAVKAITAELGSIDTLVFDEIDSGISGVTGSVVAKKISRISRSRQVICITHSPAIAAMADRSFLIEKKSDGGSTSSSVRQLGRAEHIGEIARLSGTIEGSASVGHAEEMLEWAVNFKNT